MFLAAFLHTTVAVSCCVCIWGLPVSSDESPMTCLITNVFPHRTATCLMFFFYLLIAPLYVKKV